MRKVSFFTGLIMLFISISGNVNAQTDMHKDSLSKQQQKIITIAAFAAKGDLNKLKLELVAGLEAGLTVNEIKEILVQLYAYSGFPRSLRGLQTLMSVLDERKASGINDNWGRKASPITDTRDKYERGKDILAKLSGTIPPNGRPQSGYGAFSPEIDIFLKEHLFADIFERDVLTYAQRELVTVSTLISIDGVEPMLNAHMNLCLNVGISPEQLKQLITLIEVNVDKSAADSAKVVFNELMQSRGLAVEKMQIGPVDNKTTNHIFPKGTMIKNDYFSGIAWLQMLVNANENHDISIANVAFEPGVRNNWHSHPGGQILICIKGKGYYQEKGKPIQMLSPGDVVDILPNVVHWHGATPDGEFEHIAINPQVHKGAVVWLQPVTDEEYNSYKK
jgi:quercetin dioxygenase-like cupin family protein/alkylhydroperoxidase/carboxymuconolactone decarboxylase family protein YurZ